MTRIIGFAAFLLASSPSMTFAQVALNREDAINFPSRHAWNLFLTVNHPAKDPLLGRGLPDLEKRIGTPGTSVVWETWRLSRTEVFLPKGAEPPPWDDLTLAGSPVTGKVPEAPKEAMLARLTRPMPARAPGVASPLFETELEEGVFDSRGGFGESRMNKATYEFVRSQKLYNVEGQTEFTKDFIAGKKPALSFPVDAMEVKGAWKELTPADIASGADKRYYVADFKGKKYGLTSLHIITKDIPNWFWSTFHHVDGPPPGGEPGAGTPDAFGRPAVLQGTVWENYKLGGTQTDFVTSIGTKTLLSDAFIEFGFVKSSCITCHAQARRDPTGLPLGPSSSFDAGAPNENVFLKDGKPIVAQMDFLYSLVFRAKSANDP
jgi:hypothetical protein